MTGLSAHKSQNLKGIAKVPGDKSISHRSLMLGALCHGKTTISGLLEGEDVLRTARALISMGVAIAPPDSKGGIWQVTGLGDAPPRTPRTTLYLGNSGTSARLLMGLVAGYPVAATFTGDESLEKRPMGRVIKPLAQMGARFEATAGDRLPLRIAGSANLRAIEYTLPVASAQVKSAIILAALHASGKTTIIEPVPTRDHTERMLTSMGADLQVEKQGAGNVITVQGGAPLKAQNIAVPADPSSAAFPIVAALIVPGSEVVVPNVLMNASRTGLYQTLVDMGADITFENEKEKSGEKVADIRARFSALKGVTVPPDRAPSMIDEFPILSIAAAFAQGETKMSNLGELRVKESDRLAAIAAGLAACGVRVEAGPETLSVFGTGSVPAGGATIQTHLDHRIAMSFLVMGLATPAPVTIDDEAAIGTSFPNFVKLMTSLGAHITQAQDQRKSA